MRWDALNEFLSFAKLGTLSPEQRNAYLAYAYSSRIEMIGHHDYFSARREADYSEVVAALRAVGALEQASILTAALEAVLAAGEQAPAEYSDRFAAGVRFADLAEFDDAFERCARSVPQCLLEYVEANESEFIEWRP